MSNTFSLDFNYALGQPQTVAIFRQQPEDFIVNEILGFEPSGEGEHIVLCLTKTSQNTHWVAQQLANFAQVKAMDVGYCGRKDRHAVTTQWFSLYRPNQQPLNWDQLSIPGVQVTRVDRHQRKLRPGDHCSNQFTITLKQLEQSDELITRLEAIKQGVPNYFGEQRFGWDAGNLRDGDAWAKKTLRINNKKQRGLIISALRAYLFNGVLSDRIHQKNWQQLLDGDPGENQSPSGPLWGRGRSLASGDTLEQEQGFLGQYAQWCEALEFSGLSQERRPLVCVPEDLAYQFVAPRQSGELSQLQVSFRLASGQFATSVLRELTHLDNKSQELARAAKQFHAGD